MPIPVRMSVWDKGKVKLYTGDLSQSYSSQSRVCGRSPARLAHCGPRCSHYVDGMIPLSVLDLSVTTTATPPSAALRNSIDLARHVDRLGYVRYWLAEHHSLPSVASPSPDIMIGQIAAATRHIRVGSGGVMLPNHAPLVVAERFKMLEALFPGRIDLGLGRAPGTDGTTAYALRSRLDRREGDDFLERLHELMLWETREFPAGHPYKIGRASCRERV